MIAAPSSEIPGLLARQTLSDAQRNEMFTLLNQHFEGVTRAQFEADLAAKNWVVQVRRGARLVGFTTLRVTTSDFDGEPITVIYSGDTIVAPEAWGTPALPRAWIASVNQLRSAAPERRCFWLLLTSGFRTYRFLPVFWREFYPRYDCLTPSATQRLIARLAKEAYGGLFDGMTGLVRFPQPQRLRGTLATIPEGRATNPHVAYFLARNPGHVRGDELACVTEIADANLTPAGRRVVASCPA